MYNTTTNGQAPGLVAPENDYGLTTPHSQPAKITTTNSAEFKSKIIAAYARLTGAVGQFCLAKMIQYQDGALLTMQAIVYGLLLNTAMEAFHHG